MVQVLHPKQSCRAPWGRHGCILQWWHVWCSLIWRLARFQDIPIPSPLKFPLRNWVAQVCLQIPKGCFFVKAQGGRDPGFCRQHMGFVDMLRWNNVIRSNSFFYPVFARGTSLMCFVEGHVFRPGAILHQCLKHVCGPHAPARWNHMCGMAKQPTPSLQEKSVCTTSTL